MDFSLEDIMQEEAMQGFAVHALLLAPYRALLGPSWRMIEQV
jgi:hypothetical protein